MTIEERMQGYADGLVAAAKLVEAAKPSVESIIKSIDDIIYTDTAKEFRRKRREQNERHHERLIAICRDKIQLVAEAMKAGISEEAALQILFSEFASQPEAEFSQTLSDALTKAAPLIATVVTPQVSAPIPFPDEIPSPDESEDFSDEDEEEHEITPLNAPAPAE